MAAVADRLGLSWRHLFLIRQHHRPEPPHLDDGSAHRAVIGQATVTADAVGNLTIEVHPGLASLASGEEAAKRRQRQAQLPTSCRHPQEGITRRNVDAG